MRRLNSRGRQSMGNCDLAEYLDFRHAGNALGVAQSSVAHAASISSTKR